MDSAEKLLAELYWVDEADYAPLDPESRRRLGRRLAETARAEITRRERERETVPLFLRRLLRAAERMSDEHAEQMEGGS